MSVGEENSVPRDVSPRLETLSAAKASSRAGCDGRWLEGEMGEGTRALHDARALVSVASAGIGLGSKAQGSKPIRLRVLDLEPPKLFRSRIGP